MPDDLHSLCTDAVSLLQDMPVGSRIRVISHYDADGISAAGILCQTLYSAGHDFYASLMRNPFNRGFERLATEQNPLIIFSDMGSGQIEMVEQLKTPCIILDHHQFLRKSKTKEIIQINANSCGLDGNYEACGATISYAFSQTIHQDNVRLAPLALVGAIGDKQHIGGLRGYNKTVLDHALNNDLLSCRIGSKLYGSTLKEALYYSIDPYYTGLSGDATAIKNLLDTVGLADTIKPDTLSTDQTKLLNSILMLRLLDTQVPVNIIDIAFRTRYYAPSFGYELERLADIFDACGKNGFRSLGLSISIGNQTDMTEAIKVEQDYKTKILTALHDLVHGAVQETVSFYYFFSDSSSLGGVVAGSGINYVLGGKKPLLSLARKDGELHISCRGTQALVSKGLDLGLAMKTVAQKLNGFGGGHKIAAGATINHEKETEFLQQVDTILTHQLGENI